MENFDVVYQNFQTKVSQFPFVQQSIQFLSHILKLFSFNKQQLKVSFNGGKDATIVLYLTKFALMINGSQEQIECLYFLEKQPFPEITKFVTQQVDCLNLKMSYLKCSFIEGLKQFDQLQAVIMGVRKTDPHGKNLDLITLTDNNYPPLLRINPILNWSYEDVWTFIKQFQIPYCELYNDGYTCLGCQTKTERNPELKKGQGAWEAKEENERITRIE